MPSLSDTPRVADVVLSPGLGGSYFDDQAAVREGAVRDGRTYRGTPVTEGFRAVRMPGEAVSVMLILDDGYVAIGDCALVHYAGYGGRDAPFRAADLMRAIMESVAPTLIGQSASGFRRLAEEVGEACDQSGRPLHSAIRYGVTQALLDAAAWSRRVTMAELVQEVYQLATALAQVPIFCQSNSHWDSVDSMIMKRAAVIPHGWITNVQEHVGPKGEKLREYVEWISRRVRQIGESDYTPIIHIDVYGTIGRAFGENVDAVASYFDELAAAASPHELRVEGPLDAGTRTAQIEKMRELRHALQVRGSKVGIVADEWCNTLEDVQEFADAGAADIIHVKTPDLGGIDKTVEALLYCRKAGVGAYSGGSANETDRSAQVSTNVAIACAATQCLAKPGLGVDEGLMIVSNEMNRVLALAARRGRRNQ